MTPGHLLAALDKFKGTATSLELGTAVVAAARAAGWTADVLALSDGGEGLLEVFGGPNRVTEVTAPDGRPAPAAWRLDADRAVVESALASGLHLVGGRAGNDAVAATSRGTGELVEAAVRAGARRVVLGLGGSAISDGGVGALSALSARTIDAIRDGTVELEVCCDVTTRYVDAARVFGPQKGAGPDAVALLTTRLVEQQAALALRFGVDLAGVAGGGAAGGLGGAFAALGGRLVPGFDVVAAHVGLDDAIAGAELVVTGEGCLDDSSYEGKVVGGVLARAARHGVPVLVVAGRIDTAPPAGPTTLRVVSLVDEVGEQRAMTDTPAVVAEVVAASLTRRRAEQSD